MLWFSLEWTFLDNFHNFVVPGITLESILVGSVFPRVDCGDLGGCWRLLRILMNFRVSSETERGVDLRVEMGSFWDLCLTNSMFWSHKVLIYIATTILAAFWKQNHLFSDVQMFKNIANSVVFVRFHFLNNFQNFGVAGTILESILMASGFLRDPFWRFWRTLEAP